MKRKINEVGTGTLTVSLPNKWVKKNNIKKGDEIDVIEGYKELKITCEPRNGGKSVMADLSGIKTSTLLNFVIINLYLKGYKRIELTYNEKVSTTGLYNKKEMKTFFLIDKVVNQLVGLEIIEDKPGYCVIEEITNTDSCSFDNTFRRSFLLLIEFSKNVCDNINKPNNDVNDYLSEYFHRFYSINKFFNYSLKLLSSANMPSDEILRYTLLINSLQSIGYSYSILGFMNKDAAKVRAYMEKINKLLYDFYKQCFKPGIEGLNSLASDTNDIQIQIANDKSCERFLLGIVNTLKLSIAFIPINTLIDIKKPK